MIDRQADPTWWVDEAHWPEPDPIHNVIGPRKQPLAIETGETPRTTATITTTARAEEAVRRPTGIPCFGAPSARSASDSESANKAHLVSRCYIPLSFPLL